MKKIYNFSGSLSYRNYTIKDLFDVKGKKKLSQINVKNEVETNIALDAKVELLITGLNSIKNVRSIAKNNFITVAIPFTEFKTKDEILKVNELSKNITDGTVHLSCWMTMSQIKEIKAKKVLFSEFE